MSIPKFICTIFLILFIASGSVQSQSKKARNSFRNFLDNRKPSIELSYGFSDIGLDGYPMQIANSGLLSIRLGFSSSFESKYGKNIVRYDNGYLHIENSTSGKYISNDNPGIKSEMWRFGFGNKSGYGVKIGNTSLIPYNSNSFLWSQFKYKTPANDSTDYLTLNDFNGTFRFGSGTEAGMIFQIVKGFSIQPAYEITDIFPRHLFGKQLLSSLIEASGIVLLEGFTDVIMKNSPVAGVFVSFILKSAYEYGFYQLRRGQMNWPMTSTAPLRHNTFKVGATFSF